MSLHGMVGAAASTGVFERLVCGSWRFWGAGFNSWGSGSGLCTLQR